MFGRGGPDMFTLKIILEIAAVILLLIGYWNEDKVIEFERALFAALRGEDRPVRRAEAPRRKQTVRRVPTAEEPRRVA